jgi:DNA-binding NtrC family response regulator
MMSTPLSLLLIEDNAVERLAWQKKLEKLDQALSVTTSDSIHNALLLLSQRSFHCIILDYWLTDGNGLDFLRHYQARSPQIPVIVLTGEEDATVGTGAVAAGAQDFLYKNESSPRLVLRSILYAIERFKLQNEREALLHDLQQALTNIKTLHGLLPICINCKKIRDDGGYWHQIETYIRSHSDADFSHGLCPQCRDTLYPGHKERLKRKEQINPR